MNRLPVAAVVLTVAGLTVLATLPATVSALLALLALTSALAAARAVRPLRLPLTARTAALRTAATVLVVIGGPIVAAVQLGIRAVPLMMVVAAVMVLAAPTIPALWGGARRDREVPPHDARH